MAKAVLRFAKLKTGNLPGSAGHVARTLETPNADPARRKLNLTSGNPDARSAVMDRVQAVTGGKYRKDAVVAYEFVMTAKADWFKGKSQQQVKQWAKRSLQWLRHKFGADNVVSATLHMDESAPHLHAYVVPEINGRLSAKSYTGTRKQCSDLQTSYAKAVEAFGLERGLKGSKAVHIPPSRFHALVNAQELPETPGRLASAKAWEEYRQTVAMLLAKSQAQAEHFRKANETLAKLTETIGQQDWQAVRTALDRYENAESNYWKLLQTLETTGSELEQVKTELSETQTELDRHRDTLRHLGLSNLDQLVKVIEGAYAIIERDRKNTPSHTPFPR